MSDVPRCRDRLRRATRIAVTAIFLTVLACDDPTDPREYRGVAAMDSGYPTEIVRLNDRGMVVDAVFRGPCGLRKWDLETHVDGQTVEITPHFTAIPTPDRCATALRILEGFHFYNGDSARFIFHADPDGLGPQPLGVALDTVVPFQHIGS